MARAKFIKRGRKCPRGHHCKLVGRGKNKRKLAIPNK